MKSKGEAVLSVLWDHHFSSLARREGLYTFFAINKQYQKKAISKFFTNPQFSEQQIRLMVNWFRNLDQKDAPYYIDLLKTYIKKTPRGIKGFLAFNLLEKLGFVSLNGLSKIYEGSSFQCYHFFLNCLKNNETLEISFSDFFKELEKDIYSQEALYFFSQVFFECFPKEQDQLLSRFNEEISKEASNGTMLSFCVTALSPIFFQLPDGQADTYFQDLYKACLSGAEHKNNVVKAAAWGLKKIICNASVPDVYVNEVTAYLLEHIQNQQNDESLSGHVVEFLVDIFDRIPQENSQKVITQFARLSESNLAQKSILIRDALTQFIEEQAGGILNRQDGFLDFLLKSYKKSSNPQRKNRFLKALNVLFNHASFTEREGFLEKIKEVRLEADKGILGLISPEMTFDEFKGLVHAFSETDHTKFQFGYLLNSTMLSHEKVSFLVDYYISTWGRTTSDKNLDQDDKDWMTFIVFGCLENLLNVLPEDQKEQFIQPLLEKQKISWLYVLLVSLSSNIHWLEKSKRSKVIEFLLLNAASPDTSEELFLYALKGLNKMIPYMSPDEQKETIKIFVEASDEEGEIQNRVVPLLLNRIKMLDSSQVSQIKGLLLDQITRVFRPQQVLIMGWVAKLDGYEAELQSQESTAFSMQ